MRPSLGTRMRNRQTPDVVILVTAIKAGVVDAAGMILLITPPLPRWKTW